MHSFASNIVTDAYHVMSNMANYTLATLAQSHNFWCKARVNKVQHGRYLETWYLEAGRDLGTTEADTEVGVL